MKGSLITQMVALIFDSDMGLGSPRGFWGALKIVGSPVLASVYSKISLRKIKC